MLGMPSMMGYAMPSSSLMSSLVDSSYLSGRLESGHTKKRSSDGSSGRPAPGPCSWPPAPRLPAAPRSTAAAPRPQPRSMAARPGHRSASGVRRNRAGLRAAAALWFRCGSLLGRSHHGCHWARRWSSRARKGKESGCAGSFSASPLRPSAIPRAVSSATSPPGWSGSPGRALFKKMRDVEPTLEDLEELIPAVGRNLKNILKEESEDKLESLQMTFVQIEEGGSVVELKKNGANILVTKHNRKEFVDLYVNYMLNESIRKPFEDFMQGFLRGCPSETWKLFLPVELQVVLLGHPNCDWCLLKKNVTYIYYKESHQTIRNFWTVFLKLPEEKKKKFLAFLSGSDLIIPYGLEYFQFSIEDPLCENPDDAYPSAYTCNCTLFLPRYSSKEILEEKLLSAIEYSEGFGLM